MSRSESTPSIVEQPRSGGPSNWLVSYYLDGPDVVMLVYCSVWSEVVDALVYALACCQGEVTVEVVA